MTKITALPRKSIPALPSVLAGGAYAPDELEAWFAAATKAGMMEVEMARELKVPLHRIVYFIRGAGNNILLARAKSRRALKRALGHRLAELQGVEP